MIEKTSRQKVKAAVKETNLSDRDFFLSDALTRFFEMQVRLITKKFGERVPVRILYDENDKETTGYTNGRSITFNACCSLFDDGTREKRFWNLFGGIIHEVAHILYTDTKMRQEVCESVEKGKIPIQPTDGDLTDLQAAIENEPAKAGALARIIGEVHNMLEDGYIERHFMFNFQKMTSWMYALISLRKAHLRSFPSFKEMVAQEEEERHQFYTITNLLLCYCKYQELPPETDENDERMLRLYQLIPYIDELNNTHNNYGRWQCTMNVVAALSDLILLNLEDYDDSKIETGQDPKQMSGNGGAGSPGPMDKSQSKAGNSSQTGSGKSSTAPEDSGKPNEDPGTGSPSNVFSEIENEAKEDAAEEKLEQEQAKALSEQEGNLTVSRMPKCNASAWTRVKSEIEPIVKGIVSAFRQVLKDRQQGGVIKGQYFGRNIARGSYHRQDMRYFETKKAPNDLPKLAIALAIDESGSMSGRPIEYAQKFALILYRVCQELNIPCMIIGHTDSKEIFDYTNFDGSYDGKDLYRLFGIKSRGGDSAYEAFMLCYHELEKQNAENRVLIMLSDGLPNYGYEDLQKVSRKAKQQNINIIPASIGCDVERMSAIYGSNSLNIEDVEQLPKTLLRCIKKFLQ